MLCYYIIKLREFQSTLPQGERPMVCYVYTGYRHFNPRSRKGSDFSA